MGAGERKKNKQIFFLICLDTPPRLPHSRGTQRRSRGVLTCQHSHSSGAAGCCIRSTRAERVRRKRRRRRERCRGQREGDQKEASREGTEQQKGVGREGSGGSAPSPPPSLIQAFSPPLPTLQWLQERQPRRKQKRRGNAKRERERE